MKNQQPQYSVGQLAKHADCQVETVRYYEKSGLMPAPPRSLGGHRLYDLNHLKRLHFIRRSRNLGFTLEQIKALLRFVDEPHHHCADVRELALAHIQEVEQKIADLNRMHAALENMAAQCQDAYAIDDCPIIDALFNDSEIEANT